MKNYKKGNVYLVNLNNSYPNIQNGRRPCIIVQNDYANTFSKTLIVVPITTKIKRTDLPIHVRMIQSRWLYVNISLLSQKSR